MREPCPNIRIVINLFLIMEVILGVAIIAVMVSYQYILSMFMVPMDRKLLASKFFNTYVLGFQLIASYLCSLTMWRRIWCRRYSPTIETLLSVWLFFCFLIIICGLATIWSLLNSSDALVNNAEVMLFYGIDLYYMMPEWKLLWDQLQYTQECCGVHNYQDWSHATWLPKSNTYADGDINSVNSVSANQNEHAKKRHKRYGIVWPDYEKYIEEYEATSTENDCDDEVTYEPECTTTMAPMPQITTMCPPETTVCPIETTTSMLPTPILPCDLGDNQTLAPYACCKHNSSSCYQNYLPRPENSPIPHLNLTDINNEGCLPIFSDYMHNMLNTLLILMLLAIFIDIAICCITKYIMFFNNRESCFDQDDSIPCCDDDGNALVIVQCPPKVKCITLEEQRRRYNNFDNINMADVDNNYHYCDEPENSNSNTNVRHNTSIILH